MKFETFLGHIEATHFPDSQIYVSFNALEGRKQSPEIDEPMNGQGLPKGEATELRLLDNDADDLQGKLESYMKKMCPLFYEREASEFMRSTLAVASDLSTQKKV
jgi:hypothetical protein